ncbi:Nn.00g107400.m01.CDS01 [Neocucurbitaria sp. VM-36]
MEWQRYDHARESWYYYDPTSNVFVYANGERIPGTPVSVGYRGSEAAQPASNSSTGTSHVRAPSGTNSDWSIASDLSALSISSHSATGGSSRNMTPTYRTSIPGGGIGAVGNHVTANHSYATTPVIAYPYSGFTPQASLSGHQSLNVARSPTHGLAPSYPGYTPIQLTNQTTATRPSDAELLQEVGREVILDPSDESTPPEFLSPGFLPHRILRGSTRTHGTQEKLKSSFYIRTPGYRYFKRGVVFRVLWPELKGDRAQNITIATTTFGEDIFYKIRWFVVVREGHDCCTCLSIQTYGGRGVPPNKSKSHHAIIYTGQEPLPEPHEIVTDEPSMGQSIRVIGSELWNKMDSKSRVNFLKPYTVEHNVKVEHFGSVDPNDEWKLIAQFNSHWGIQGNEPLQPATRSRFYDRSTYGPAPSTRVPGYAGSNVTAPPAATYNTNSTMYSPYNNIPPIDEHTASGHQYQDTPANTYTNSRNADYPYTYSSNVAHTTSNNTAYDGSAVADETYDTNPRPAHHRRSSSHRSERNYSTRRQY